ncbi:MAG: UvrD-helicase domain-containing protein [Muribaculaceae bacterium]|nr:UvrD-helicase domain-containing protein [Muribaculaceae bacterium]
MLEIRKASAGSGKTFQLARKYVLNVLSTTDKSGNLTLNPDPTEAHRRILAITFTNKATAEMKARIISEIARLAYVNDGSFVKSDHRNYLCNELNCSPAELQQAASKALSSILFSYHYFNVSTIDSFFQLVLRNFAREVDLNGDYNVEVGDDQAINIAVQLMLDQAKRDSIENRQSTLLRLINSFMANRFAEGKKFNIFNRNSSDVSEIVSSVKKLLNEDFKLNTDLQEYLKDDKKLPEFAEKIRKEYKKPLDDIAKEAQYVINKYPFVQGVVNKNAFNAFQKLANKDLGPFSNATFPKIAKGEANYYNNKINIDDKTKEDIKSKALEIRQSYNDYCTLDAICGNLADLEFLKEVLSFIKQYREDNNLILISDTNDILSRIIGNSDAPFIYERIGTEISNYLLDEFQDTSRMQWNNLKPLVDNADSEGGHNLIIGDEKQSIYRFRNADYSLLYEGVKNEIPSATVIDGSNPDDNTNWRSARDVVEFNNKFFEQYAKRESLQPNIYEYVRQGIAPKNNDLRGLVLFNNLPQKNFKKAALDVLVSDIKKALHNGFGWGDITVLVNANKEGQEIIDYLLKYKNDNPQDKDFDNFKVVSEESLLISRADSVRFIVSALRLLDPTAIENAKGKDKFSTAELACRYYYAVMKERSLDALDMSRILAETLDKNSDYSLQTEEFVGVFEKDNSTSLVTIVEQIIRQYVPEALLKEENIYLQAFSDVVVEMSARGINSVHTFLAWWDDKGIEKGIELPSGSGMMQVMTIHKSKGLEFPCVIIPFADWELEKNKGVSWFKKEPIEDYLVNDLSISKDIIPPMLPIENKSALTNTGFKAQYEKNGVAARLDSMNKAYVAFTRAISRLIVTFKESNKRFFGITINDIISSPEVQMETISSEDNPELLEGASVCFYGDKDSKKVEKPNDDDHFGIHSILKDEMSKYVVDAYSVSPLNEEFKMLSSDEGLPYNSLEIQEGTILHDVMRSIRHKEANVETLVRRKTMRLGLSSEVVNSYVEKIKKALANPDAARWFEGYTRLINERPIAIEPDKKGNTTLRADRVVEYPDGHIEIIDYKFGKAYDKYKAKMKEYVELYRQLGYDKVEGYIWYVADGKIEKV